MVRDTALHLGKDFAVSPICFHMITPKGARRLSTLTSLLAPRESLRTGVTRYLAPPKKMEVFGLSSPKKESNYLTRTIHYTIKYRKVNNLLKAT